MSVFNQNNHICKQLTLQKDKNPIKHLNAVYFTQMLFLDNFIYFNAEIVSEMPGGNPFKLPLVSFSQVPIVL